MDRGTDRNFYRETVQNSGVGNVKIIRQRNGVGVYAHVRVEIHPLNLGQGAIFTWNAGLNIPARFVDAVSQGIHDAMNAGTLAGFELTDVSVTVADGSYHDVDSTAEAFREAADKATREAVFQGGPVILEAQSYVTIHVPDSLVAAAEAALRAREGRRQVAHSATQSTISASLPSSRVPGLIEDLLQISDGHAKISICDSGFHPRHEPPDRIEQWVIH